MEAEEPTYFISEDFNKGPLFNAAAWLQNQLTKTVNKLSLEAERI